jgi:septum formation protein
MDNVTRAWTFILGSASPRRKELLGYLHCPFLVRVSPTSEVSIKKRPRDYARDIACQKSDALWEMLKYQEANLLRKSVLLTCDTVVSQGELKLGKPANAAEAQAMWKKLCHRPHTVTTALYLRVAEKGVSHKIFQTTVQTQVKFVSNPSPFLFKKYLHSGDPLDKAGGYGIQGPAMAMIQEIRGSWDNVVGLPLASLDSLMQNKVGAFLKWKKPWQHYFQQK